MSGTCPSWSDVFTPTRRAKTHGGWKTTPADKITWHGIVNGRVVCVVSTVRLIEGGMAHFTVSSNARIGENAWNLHGGHFVDLAVSSRHPLADDELRWIGELALTEEARPLAVRRSEERLSAAITIRSEKEGSP